MTYDFVGNNLLIELPERINESNAAEVKEEILAIMEKNPGHRPDLDLRNLKYISSSGLRSFLSIQKKYGEGPISLKNVTKDVNSILEMTGFDSIFNVSKMLHQCNVEGCKILANCINGKLYALKGGMMVKAFNPDISLEDVEQEIRMAQKAMGCGIPTPISFSTVKCGEGFGIIYEELNGESIASILRRNPGSMVSCAKKLATCLKELHEIKILPDRLPSIKDRYRGWLQQAKNKIPDEDWNQLNALVETLSNLDTFVHGDLSLDKVFIVDDEIMLMDMASCGYGHPTFDLQALYASLVAIEIDNPGYCAQKLGLDAGLCRKFWKSFERFYLEIDGLTEDANEKISKMNQILSRYYMLKEELLDTLYK